MSDDPTSLFNAEAIAATLAHLAAGEGDTASVAALAAANPKLAVTGYDNWNGGTYELTLYLEVPLQVFGQLYRVREAMEKNLLTMLKPLIEAEPGFWAVAATLIPVDKIPANWREECMSTLHGGGHSQPGLALRRRQAAPSLEQSAVPLPDGNSHRRSPRAD